MLNLFAMPTRTRMVYRIPMLAGFIGLIHWRWRRTFSSNKLHKKHANSLRSLYKEITIMIWRIGFWMMMGSLEFNLSLGNHWSLSEFFKLLSNFCIHVELQIELLLHVKLISIWTSYYGDYLWEPLQSRLLTSWGLWKCLTVFRQIRFF